MEREGEGELGGINQHGGENEEWHFAHGAALGVYLVGLTAGRITLRSIHSRLKAFLISRGRILLAKEVSSWQACSLGAATPLVAVALETLFHFPQFCPML